jgi:hypothetical protein
MKCSILPGQSGYHTRLVLQRSPGFDLQLSQSFFGFVLGVWGALSLMNSYFDQVTTSGGITTVHSASFALSNAVVKQFFTFYY